VQAPGDDGPLGDEVRRRLEVVSTATITTRLLARGLRNTFLHGLAQLRPYGRNMVGPAFTLRYVPAREDIDVLSAFRDYDHPQRQAIEGTPAGGVLVMDCRGADRAASAGDILLTRLAYRGVAGMVTDGSVRDADTIAELDFPVYVQSRSAMTNLALHHAVDINVPIGCAGVAVYPNDVIVGDGDGVVCIPRHLAAEVSIEAAEQEAMERKIRRRVQHGAPLRGTYPPDDMTRKQLLAELSEDGEPAYEGVSEL
jgi:regulator of RNase E activity RraA